jgi:hypothetical protein
MNEYAPLLCPDPLDQVTGHKLFNNASLREFLLVTAAAEINSQHPLARAVVTYTMMSLAALTRTPTGTPRPSVVRHLPVFHPLGAVFHPLRTVFHPLVAVFHPLQAVFHPLGARVSQRTFIQSKFKGIEIKI